MIQAIPTMVCHSFADIVCFPLIDAGRALIFCGRKATAMIPVGSGISALFQEETAVPIKPGTGRETVIRRQPRIRSKALTPTTDY